MAFKRDKLKVLMVVAGVIVSLSLVITMGILGVTLYKIANIQTKSIEKIVEVYKYNSDDKLEIENLKLELDKMKVQNEYLEKSVSTLTDKKKKADTITKESASSKKQSIKPYETNKIQQNKLADYWYAYDRAKIKRKHYMAESHIKHLINILDTRKHRVDPHIILAMYELESNFQYNIKTKGGSGYGQLIYSTGKWRYERVLKLGEYKREYALDPIINITITADYFAWLVGKYKGDIQKAMKEYSGNAIGSRYQELVDKRLRKNTGKGLEYYNKISKVNYNGGNKK